MEYIPTNWSIPYYNMAFEEYVLENPDFSGDYVFFYIHEPSVIIGKHQNAAAEINMEYARTHNIYIARRLSGGGAVYHDGGNLNFSFIARRRANQFVDFEPFTTPIITALASLGVSASLSGRNDLLIDGKKFSGNAQCLWREQVLSHGTLMLDVNVAEMLSVLTPNVLKLTSKAIESVRSRVANLNDYLPEPMSAESLRSYLVSAFFPDGQIRERRLTATDIAAVEEKVKSKFGCWSYNIAPALSYSNVKTRKFPAGLITAGFDVGRGAIERISFSGDFFVNRPLEILEQRLLGVRIEEDALSRAIGIQDVIVGLSTADICELLLG